MKKKRKIIGLLLLAAACVCAVLAAMGYFRNRKNADNDQKVREAVETQTIDDTADSIPNEPDSAVSSPDSSENREDLSTDTAVSANENVPIDFNELKKECPDAYAWIRIDGTAVDYPIVQAEGDQSYYLTHSAEREKSAAGAIYTEDLNRKDFTDPVTVIYGHNMKNGSMFRTLHRFEDRAFFDSHREILIYLPGKVLHFRIFAAYNSDDKHILNSYNFYDRNIYQNYLNEVRSKKSMTSFVADDISVTPDDRIVILSTCNGNSSQRYLVQAVEYKP